MRLRLPLNAAAAGLAALAALVLCAPAGATSPAKLLAKFQPVIRFDPLEAFRPTTVESFVEDTDLERLTGPNTWTVVDPTPEADALPGPGSGIWRLNHDVCTSAVGLASVACYRAAGEDGRNVVYGRVTAGADRIVLQYWYFYDDNFYSYEYPPTDFIWQAHEGDWEVVNVVLTDTGRPLFTAYSQHCLGERRAWLDTPRWRGHHPIVYVAVGSHANYYVPGTHPIDVRCIPAQAIAILQQAGLALPVDYAAEGPAAGPAKLDGEETAIVRVGDDGPSWLAFPGFWGELEFFHGPAPVGTVPSGPSPVGPAYHAVWREPLATLATWTEG
jgi:hypothetical protein